MKCRDSRGSRVIAFALAVGASGIVLAASLAGCTRTDSIVADPQGPVAKESTPKVTTREVANVEVEAGKLELQEPEAHAPPKRPRVPFATRVLTRSDFSILATPCAANDAGSNAGVTSDCGTKGTVSRVMITGEGDLSGILPGVATVAVERLGSMPIGDGYGMGRATVAIEENRVWVEEVCMVCRLIVSRVTLVALDSATDTQVDELQARLQLPASPRLRTTAAWTRALTNTKRPR